ncbi:GtrA family protein [Streptomyces sp. NPDC052693]|uniref:GtrA family protein n=1 Tax=unclassified Streptomyces TaxID=2593676 RepID=UPI0034225F68
MNAQLPRFALVGAVNTTVYYALYLLLLTFLPYTAAHVSAFTLATVSSFFLNARFTYRTAVSWRKFLRFPLSVLVNLCVSTGGLYLLVREAHVDSRIASLAAAAVAVPVTFLVARRIMLTDHRVSER